MRLVGADPRHRSCAAPLLQRDKGVAPCAELARVERVERQRHRTMTTCLAALCMYWQTCVRAWVFYVRGMTDRGTTW